MQGSAREALICGHNKSTSATKKQILMAKKEVTHSLCVLIINCCCIVHFLPFTVCSLMESMQTVHFDCVQSWILHSVKETGGDVHDLCLSCHSDILMTEMKCCYLDCFFMTRKFKAKMYFYTQRKQGGRKNPLRLDEILYQLHCEVI